MKRPLLVAAVVAWIICTVAWLRGVDTQEPRKQLPDTPVHPHTSTAPIDGIEPSLFSDSLIQTPEDIPPPPAPPHREEPSHNHEHRPQPPTPVDARPLARITPGAEVNMLAPGTVPRPWAPSVFIEGDLTTEHSGPAEGDHFCARYPRRPHVKIELPEHPEHPSMAYSVRPLRDQPTDDTKSVLIYQVGMEELVPDYVNIEMLPGGSQGTRFQVKCPIKCEYTRVPEDLATVDAVAHFELPDERWLTEEYLGHPGRLHIAWGNEAPFKNIEYFSNRELMKKFDMTWHWNRHASVLGPCHDDKFYAHDSHFTDTPNLSPLFCSPGPKKALPLAVAVMQYCSSGNERIEIIDELKQLGLAVGEYGGCRGSPSTESTPTHFNLFWSKYNRKVQVLSEHKFTLAFENDNTPDWVTEKVYHALAAGSIPVYLGPTNVVEFVPPHSVIQVRDWPNRKDLVDYLHYLDRNTTAYDEYFAWKNTNTWTFKSYVALSSKRYQACGGCLAVYDERERLKRAGLWDKRHPWERRDTYQILSYDEGFINEKY